ncbi:MAG: PAS domain S-box protein [Candidatus Methylumidiphilus sp.]
MPAETSPAPRHASHGRILGVVLVYAVLAASWIVLSDGLVQRLFSEPQQIILASMLKGWLYVGITSMLLYGLLRRWDCAAAAAPTPADPRRLRGAFLVLAAVIATLTGIAVLDTFNRQKETEIARLQAIADLKTRQIADWLRERQGDAEFVTGSDFFAEQYRLWQEAGNAQSGERLHLRLESLRKSRGFAAVTLLKPDGQRLWASAQAPQSLSADAQATALRAGTERKVWRFGPYRDTAGAVRLDFAAPLAAFTGAPPVVLLHIDLADWLFPMLQSWPAPSASGETLLFRQAGQDVLYLSRLRYAPDAAGKLRLSMATAKLLSAQVLRGEMTLGSAGEGLDYRGVPTIGVVRGVASTDWFMVAKRDQAELYAEAQANAAWIGLAGVLALLMAGAGFHLLRQSQQLALAQAVQQSQAERLQAMRLLAAIADSSDDAIFAKDLDGRFTLFNRAASQFAGQPAEAMLGRDERAIFPPEQAERLLAANRQAIAEDRIFTVEETLPTPDGERVFLTTKGPLRDAEGKVIGLFGIVRDITLRKRVEAELRLWAQAFEHAGFGLAIGDARRNVFLAVNPAFARERGYRPEEMVGRPITMAYPADQAEVVNRRFHDLDIRSHSIFESEHVCKDGRRFPVLMDVTVIRDAAGQPVTRVAYALDITERKRAEAELLQRNAELERFNRAMVGRELDMIALKQQVNALSRQLGVEPPYPLAFLDGQPPPDGGQP